MRYCLCWKNRRDGEKGISDYRRRFGRRSLDDLVVNKLRGTFNTLAIKLPGLRRQEKEMLQDIATVTGAKVISEEVGFEAGQSGNSDVGQSQKSHRHQRQHHDSRGKGQKSDIDARIVGIRKEMAKKRFQF